MRTLRSSHTYALNATSEPKTTRYPIARRDFHETAPGWNEPKSPPIALTISDATPPHSISIPVATAGRSGKDAVRAQREPAAHAAAAAMTVSAPTVSTAPAP